MGGRKEDLQFGLLQLYGLEGKLVMKLGRVKKPFHTQARREALWALAFLSPYLIIFIIWQVFPLLYGLWLSFSNLDLLHSSAVQFVGFSNFTRILSDSFVGLSLKNTLYFTAGSVGLCILLALALASAMNGTSFENKWLKMGLLYPLSDGGFCYSYRLEANLSGIL